MRENPFERRKREARLRAQQAERRPKQEESRPGLPRRVWESVKAIAANPGEFAKGIVTEPVRAARGSVSLTPKERADLERGLSEGDIDTGTAIRTALSAAFRNPLRPDVAGALAAKLDPKNEVLPSQRKRDMMDTGLNVGGLVAQPFAAAKTGAAAARVASRLGASAQNVRRAATAGRVVGGAAADAAIGAAQTPNDRAVGAVLGGAFSVASDAVTGTAGRAIGKATGRALDKAKAARRALDKMAGALDVRSNPFEELKARKQDASATSPELVGASEDEPSAGKPPVREQPEPEATPEATPEPEPTPERTPEPEATPERTPGPKATPDVVPEPMPELTPEAAPAPARRRRPVVFSDGTKLDGEYVIMDAKQLVASHDPFSFRPRGDYPEGVQGRRYERDPAAQESVQRIALELDPDRLLDLTSTPELGPPTVTPDGRSIAGNNRVMSIQRSLVDAPQRYAEYVAALRQRAADFGLSEADFAGIENPVLVRRVDVTDPEQMAALNRASDRTTTKAKSAMDDAAGRAVQFRRAGNALAYLASSETGVGESTLAEYLSSRNGREFVRRLVEDGVFTPEEMARYVDPTTNALTEDGKATIRRTLLVAGLGDVATVERAPASAINRLEGTIPYLVRADAVGGAEFSPAPLVREALDLLTSAKLTGMTPAMYAAQGNLLGDATVRPEAVQIAELLNSGKKADVTERFREYSTQVAEEMARRARGPDMFGNVSSETAEQIAARTLLKGWSGPEPVVSGDVASVATALEAAITAGTAPRFAIATVRALREAEAALQAALDGVDDALPEHVARNRIEELIEVARDPVGAVRRALTDADVVSAPDASLVPGAKAFWGDQLTADVAVGVGVGHVHTGWMLAADVVRGRKAGLALDAIELPAAREALLKASRRTRKRAVERIEALRERVRAQREELADVLTPAELSDLDDLIDNGGRWYVEGFDEAMADASTPRAPRTRTQRAEAEDAADVVAGAPARRPIRDRLQRSLFDPAPRPRAEGSPGGGLPTRLNDPITADEMARRRNELGAEPSGIRTGPDQGEMFDAPARPIPRTTSGVTSPWSPGQSQGGWVRGRRFKDMRPDAPDKPGPLPPPNVAVPGPRGEAKALRTIARELSRGLGAVVYEGYMDRANRKGTMGRFMLRRGGIEALAGDTRVVSRGSLGVVAHELGHYLSARYLGSVGRGGVSLVGTRARVLQKTERAAFDELNELGFALYGSRKPLGTNAGYHEEGIAEWVRRYVVDQDNLRAETPNATSFLEEVLLEREPDVAKALDRARQQYLEWEAASAVGRLDAQISVGGRSTRAASDLARAVGLERLPTWMAAIWDKSRLGRRDMTSFEVAQIKDEMVRDLAVAWLDRTQPMKDAVAKLRKQGANIPISEDPAVLMQRMMGSRGAAEVLLDHGVRDPFTGETLTQTGIRTILRGLNDEGAQQFRRYLVAARVVKDLAPRGLWSGIELADAQRIVQAYEPIYGKRAQQLYEYQRGLLALRVRHGLLTLDQAQAILRVNLHRVGFYRVFEESEALTRASRQFGASATESGVRRIGSSDRILVDPLESIVADTYSTLLDIQRRKVVADMVRAAETTDFGGQMIAKIETPEVARRLGLFDQRILKQLHAMGFRFTEELADGSLAIVDGKVDDVMEAMLGIASPADFTLFWKEARTNTTGKDARELVFPIRRPNGTVSWYQVADPALFESLFDLSPGERSWALSLAKRFTSLKRQGITLNPAFIFRNVIRDAQSAAVYSRSEKPLIVPGTHMALAVADWVQGIKQGRAEGLSLRESLTRGGDAMQRFKLLGGDNAAMLRMDRADHQAMLERANRQASINVTTRAGRVVKVPIQFLRSVGRGYARIGGSLENATRLGEFQLVRGEARAAGQRAIDADVRGAIAARDVSVDFSRFGRAGVVMNKLVAFFNPALQSSVRFGREFNPLNLTKGGKVAARTARLYARAAAFITTPSVLLYLYQKDDEVYQQIPQWFKDSHWTFVYRYEEEGEERYRIFALPKPFELGFVFGTIPERILRRVIDDDPRAFDGIMSGIAANLIPPILPTAIMPFIELSVGEDFYRNRHIAPPRLQAQEAWRQAWPYNGEFSRALGIVARDFGRATGIQSLEDGISPAKIEHAVGQFLGPVGRDYALKPLDMATKGIRKLAGMEPLAPEADVVRRDAGWRDLPFIRAFVRGELGDDAETVQQVYRQAEIAERKRATWRGLITDGDTDRAVEYFLKHRDEIALVAAKKDVDDGFFTEVGPLREATSAFRKGRKVAELVNNADLTDRIKARILRDYYRDRQEFAAEKLSKADSMRAGRRAEDDGGVLRAVGLLGGAATERMR